MYEYMHIVRVHTGSSMYPCTMYTWYLVSASTLYDVRVGLLYVHICTCMYEHYEHTYVAQGGTSPRQVRSEDAVAAAIAAFRQDDAPSPRRITVDGQGNVIHASQLTGRESPDVIIF